MLFNVVVQIAKLIMESRVSSFFFFSPGLQHQKNSQRKSNNTTVYQNFLFHIYMKLNVFRATHRPSSEAQYYTSSLWFCIYVQQPFTYAIAEAAVAVLGS
jgi:hypothetical protein